MNKIFGNLAKILLLVVFCASVNAEELEEVEPPESGTAFVVGGGVLPYDVVGRFIKLAGGQKAKIVLIPTASETLSLCNIEEQEKLTRPLVEAGAWNVQIVHADTREEADSEEFVKAFEDIDAIWFSGGAQQLLAERYRKTLTHRKIVRFFNRGGVVAGTSAGAAVMSGLMIVCSSEDDPNQPVLGQGFGFINAVIDQHFLRRNRPPRLSNALDRNPGLAGVGIDEEMAVIFDLGKRRVVEVVGQTSVVHFHIPMPEGKKHRFVELKQGIAELDLTW